MALSYISDMNGKFLSFSFLQPDFQSRCYRGRDRVLIHLNPNLTHESAAHEPNSKYLASSLSIQPSSEPLSPRGDELTWQWKPSLQTGAYRSRVHYKHPRG